jgi:hypothetical protein
MENNNQQATVNIQAWIDTDGKMNMRMDIDGFTRKQVATLGVLLENQIMDVICDGLKMPQHISEILTEKNIIHGNKKN